MPRKKQTKIRTIKLTGGYVIDTHWIEPGPAWNFWRLNAELLDPDGYRIWKETLHGEGWRDKDLIGMFSVYAETDGLLRRFLGSETPADAELAERPYMHEIGGSSKSFVEHRLCDEIARRPHLAEQIFKLGLTTLLSRVKADPPSLTGKQSRSLAGILLSMLEHHMDEVPPRNHPLTLREIYDERLRAAKSSANDAGPTDDER